MSLCKRNRLKETSKENFKERGAQQNPVDQVLILGHQILHSLNSWLQRSGEMPIDTRYESGVRFCLEVNAHYEQKFKSGLITETQMYSNFVKSIKRKFSQRSTNTHQHKQSQVSTSRNVNDAWGDVTQYAPCSTDDIDLGTCMNSIAAVAGFNFQVSSDICPIHSELKIKAGSSLICGTCAKENVIQSNLEHQKAVDAMVRKKTL